MNWKLSAISTQILQVYNFLFQNEWRFRKPIFAPLLYCFTHLVSKMILLMSTEDREWAISLEPANLRFIVMFGWMNSLDEVSWKGLFFCYYETFISFYSPRTRAYELGPMFSTEKRLKVAFCTQAIDHDFLNFATKFHFRYISVKAYAIFPLARKGADAIKNTIRGKWDEYYPVLLTACDTEKGQFSVFPTMVSSNHNENSSILII